ncbi:MAG: gephyrin-like molybdotransferase Glp [Aquisalimonadaceae bacterium]
MTEQADRIAQAPSCEDDADPVSLTVDQAWDRILTDIAPVQGKERVNVRRALGRVLAEDVHSDVDVPAHDNAAMDGYALRRADLATTGVTTLRVVARVLAGHTHTEALKPGECVRIMTGAPIPEGADTVVMQEKAERHGDEVRIGADNEPGQNVRPAGEDFARGQRVLPAGKRIGPAELGMLGSLGLVEISVWRRLRVAYFSTGDELRSAGTALGPGQIYDSNRYTLHAVLERLGVEATDMGVVADDPDTVERAFSDAASFADAIITSGGVSVGEADHVKTILGKLGKVDFWKIAMRPGRPMAFGTIGRARFFGMPGNPVSVVATWYQFVQPALRRLMGETIYKPLRFRVRTTHRLRKRPGRTEFQRGILQQDANGELTVSNTGAQGSGILHSVSMANCFIVIPHASGAVEAGQYVDVQPFEGIMM